VRSTLQPAQVYLGLDQYDLLKKVCRVTGLSMSRLMRSALTHYMRVQCQALFNMTPREAEQAEEQELKALWVIHVKKDATAAQDSASKPHNP
jgi:hypothetical protein